MTVIMAVNPAVSINLIDDVVMLTDSDDDGAETAAVAALQPPKGESNAERKPADIDKPVTPAELEKPPCLLALQAPKEESEAEQKPADIDKPVTLAEVEGPCLLALQAPQEESNAEQKPADIDNQEEQVSPVTPADAEEAGVQSEEALPSSCPPGPVHLWRPLSPMETEALMCYCGTCCHCLEEKADIAAFAAAAAAETAAASAAAKAAEAPKRKAMKAMKATAATPIKKKATKAKANKFRWGPAMICMNAKYRLYLIFEAAMDAKVTEAVNAMHKGKGKGKGKGKAFDAFEEDPFIQMLREARARPSTPSRKTPSSRC